MSSGPNAGPLTEGNYRKSRFLWERYALGSLSPRPECEVTRRQGFSERGKRVIRLDPDPLTDVLVRRED